ncbi:phosphotransferase [Paenibacillus oryzisoli]|uniref:Aminoglycoside phosphotransferase domain-containing protein n=1 Tax=Paenibacillus oryzisoli TaxID=1850517 RepID=A0A198A4Q3_9BACL|nr:phosphotransferase [Paenibacillus oryzisoli]OAS16469.1 hypothetical protein A8708_20925 [Paenibacillus oryzisoli]
MENELLAEIADTYGLSIKQVETIRDTSRSYVLKITATQGSFVLKRMHMDTRRLQFMLETEDFLRNRGIHIPMVYQTKENKKYVAYTGHLYVLQEWICAHSYPLVSVEKAVKLAEILGRMHELSKVFYSSHGILRFGGAKWVQEYDEALHFLGSWKSKQEDVEEPWRKAVLTYIDFYMRTGEYVKEHINACYTAGGEVHAQVVLSHHDFHMQNILMDPSGDVYIIDWEFVRFDLPSRDVNRLLYAMIKKSKTWNHRAFVTVMRAYLQMNPLSKHEMKLLYLDLAFPHNLCRNLIWGKFRGMTENQTHDLLQKEAAKTEFMIELYHSQS